MSQALSSQRSWIARIAVLAMVASLMAFGAAPAGAAIDTSASCPDSIPDAGFTDLAGVPAAAVDAINCIAEYGISTGTTATTFAPFETVERWQMALFLTRQATAHGLGSALPAGTDQGFTDLAGVPAAAVTAINQIAELGISTGTSATTFDPFGTVERWQMALFLQRLITIAVTDNVPAVTLPDGSDQGFTDLAGVPASAVTAINVIAQLDVADGTTATTFDPFGAVERWAMALFLARTLAADGIVPAGTNNIVTDFDDASDPKTFSYADAAAGEEVEVETDPDDTFIIDGIGASEGVFYTQIDIGDLVSVSGTTYSLTNVDAEDTYLSGPVDLPNFDAADNVTSFSIVEPITGVELNTVVGVDGDFTIFTVDGGSVSLASFSDDLQAGDTVVVSDRADGDDATDLRTISMTNVDVVGTISDIDDPALGNFKVDPFAQVFLVDDADTVTIDGELIDDADEVTEWNDNATECDEVTVTREGDLIDLELENCPIGSFDGLATGTFVPGTSVEVDFVDDDRDGSVTYQVLDAAGNEQRFIVDGELVTEAEFEDEITVGDLITWTPVDGEIVEESILELTNAVGLVALDIDTFTAAANTVTVELDQGDDTLVSATINYTLTANVGISGDDIVYQINGEDSTDEAEWEIDAAALAGTSAGATLTISESGGDIVYNVVSG